MKTNPWVTIIKATGTVNSIRASSKFHIYWAVGSNSKYQLWFNHSVENDWDHSFDAFHSFLIEHYKVDQIYRVVIELFKNEDISFFFKLCEDLIACAEEFNRENEMLEAVHNRLIFWQRFFSKKASNIMSKEEQLGLVGELFFLKNHLLGIYSDLEVCQFWKGPEKSKQDFIFGKNAIEVKTKEAGTNDRITISSPEQLDTIHLNIFLYVLTLGPATIIESGCFSLYDLVNSINSEITDVKARSIFIEKLNLLGYLPLDEYDFLQYVKLSEVFFTISDGFPVIKRASIHQAVDSVQYTIKLTSCNEYRLIYPSFLKGDGNG